VQPDQVHLGPSTVCAETDQDRPPESPGQYLLVEKDWEEQEGDDEDHEEGYLEQSGLEASREYHESAVRPDEDD
jgi:hypothetical protein